MNPYLGYNSTLVIVHKKLPICFGVGVSFAISVLVGYIRRVLDFECEWIPCDYEGGFTLWYIPV